MKTNARIKPTSNDDDNPLLRCVPWDEIALRSTWWRLCRHHGEQLPAEPDVIVIQGGK